MVSLTLFWSLPVGGFRAKAVASIIGGTLGLFIGRSVWRRVRQRIYGRNRVSLYFTDTFTYVLLFAAALVTLVPRSVLHAGAALVEHPGVLTAGLSAMASAGLAMTLAGYWQMRRYELEHGPLRPKYLYASSSTGAEGMLGKQAIVRAKSTGSAFSSKASVRTRTERMARRSPPDCFVLSHAST
jgi:hypothetical protein